MCDDLCVMICPSATPTTTTRVRDGCSAPPRHVCLLSATVNQASVFLRTEALGGGGRGGIEFVVGDNNKWRGVLKGQAAVRLLSVAPASAGAPCTLPLVPQTLLMTALTSDLLRRSLARGGGGGGGDRERGIEPRESVEREGLS